MGGEDCPVSFRARIVGTMRKIPTLFRVSGYRPAAFGGPDIAVSYD